MFDDPLGGGAGLLNTSMKSEGGQSGREDGDVDTTVGGGEKSVSGNDGEGQLALDVDSIKIMAETVAMGGISEEAAREIAEEVTYRLRQLTQDSAKFMHHGKRAKLLCDDVDQALRMTGQEPLYGFQAGEHVPFRFASGGGRELHFLEDKELDLTELVSAQLPKIPVSASIRAHWLAIDGVQPAIPENPPPQSKDQLVADSVDPAAKLKSGDARDNKLGTVLGTLHKMKTVETVNVKQLASHELSVEQQLYYKEITEACVGSDEARRAEALQSLACDPGLHQMLPRLCTFIAEGVRVNVVQHNLAILIYLMRMVKSLLENQTLYLEKYLHELIPAVGTCIVSRQLCTRPDHDNHWALRDFASRMMAAICKNFHSSTNNVQTRVTKMFSDALCSDRAPLVSYYGAIAGLQELGPEVIKVFVLPHIGALAAKIDMALDTSNSTSRVEEIAAQNIRTLLVKSVSPVLKSVRSPPDHIEEYKASYGSLGPYLQVGVVRSRQQSGSKTTQSSSTAPPTTTPRVSTPGLTAPSPKMGTSTPTASNQQKVFVVSNQQMRGTPTMPNAAMSPLTMPSMPAMVTTLPNSPHQTVTLPNTPHRPGQPLPGQGAPANLGVRSVFGQPGPGNSYQ